MVLRPVLWLGLAYIAGEILVWMKFADPAVWIWMACSCLCLTAAAGLIMNKRLYTFFTGRSPDKKTADLAVLIGLPVFFIFGAMRFYTAMDGALSRDAVMEVMIAGQDRLQTFSGTLDGIEEKTNSWYFFVKDCDPAVGGQLLVSVNKADMTVDGESYTAGDKVAFKGELELFSHPANEGAFDEWLYYHSREIAARVWSDSVTVTRQSTSWPQQAAKAVRQWMKKGCQTWLSPEYAGITVSMVCGDKALMDDELQSLYQKSGISHILAISGLHVTFLGMGICSLLGRLHLPRWMCILAGMVIVLVYGWFTGMEPSTCRSVVMTIVSLGARWLGRTYDIKNGLALAALWILIPSPLMVTQPGFLLSFIAVGSLVLCPAFGEPSPKRDKKGAKAIVGLWLLRVKSSMVSPVFVTLGMLPVLSWCFFEVSMYSIFINLAVIPLMSLVYPAMLVCALTAPLLGEGGFLLYRLIEGILAVYEGLCRLTVEIPGAVVITGQPSSGEMVLIYGMFLAAAFVFCRAQELAPGLYKRLWHLGSLFFVTVGCLLIFLEKTPEKMTVTMVDVGQGDCFFIQLPDGENILVDGGSSDEKQMGTYILTPFLKSRGVRRLDGVFLSHMDTDHVNGVQEMMGSVFWNGKDGSRVPGSIAVEALFMPGNVSSGGGHETLMALAGAMGTKCYGLWAGQTVDIGALEIAVAAPDREETAGGENYETAGEDSADRNDGSLVLYMSYGDFAMLFTGDISQKAEEDVIRTMESLGLKGCHVLKVAHHGSRGSSGDAFLDYVRPQAALISCGRDNSYGHPHGELLERLSRYCGNIYVTAKDGAVKTETDGKFIKTVVWSWKDGYNIRQEE